MSLEFFSCRKRFDFSRNILDVGTPVNWDKEKYTRFVYNKIFKLGPERFPEFYEYHLNYYKRTQPHAEEHKFFVFFLEEMTQELNRLNRISVYDENHVRNLHQKNTVEAVIKYLESKDNWNANESKDSTISRLNLKIESLEKENEQLKAKLKEARRLETEDYIRIKDKHLLPFLDIVIQLQDVKTDDGDELVFSQTQAVWVKMIAKHFRHGSKEISLDTLYRYFPADKRNPGTKYATIPSKSRLFLLERAKKRA